MCTLRYIGGARVSYLIYGDESLLVEIVLQVVESSVIPVDSRAALVPV